MIFKSQIKIKLFLEHKQRHRPRLWRGIIKTKKLADFNFLISDLLSPLNSQNDINFLLITLKRKLSYLFWANISFFPWSKVVNVLLSAILFQNRSYFMNVGHLSILFRRSVVWIPSFYLLQVLLIFVFFQIIKFVIAFDCLLIKTIQVHFLM